jgi:hypothetical protein
MKIRFKLYVGDDQLYVVDSHRTFNRQEGIEAAYGILEENGELPMINSLGWAEVHFERLIDNKEIRVVGDDLYAWDDDVKIDDEE